MENPEELLHTLEEYSKIKPKDIPRELEEYLCFVAKTGDPVYQWGSIKHLLKEKLINVVNDFHESCPAVEIPPCPNVEIFKYDTMKSFILEKLDTFTAAPFTVQRICELLTTPRKEYNRIDKFMRALEKNILVVSTVEPGCKSAENGEGIVNGLESEHMPENSNCSTDINVVEMDESSSWPQNEIPFHSNQNSTGTQVDLEICQPDKESLSCSSTENIEILEPTKEDTPVNSSNEETIENSDSLEINVDSLPTQAENDVDPEPVVSSEIVDEVTESEAVSSETSKEPADEETSTTETSDENLKLADSTTSSKSPPPLPEIVPIEEIIESQENCEIVSSENENNTDTDSNQSLPSSESDSTPIETKEIEECNEDSNSSSAADTTKGYEIPPKTEENKDEEISSTDKIIITAPNTSIDDISDDESEAEAEVQKETTPQIECVNETVPENEPEVTASTDNSSKDCPEIPMEVDSKEKVDFNEAETTCESI